MPRHSQPYRAHLTEQHSDALWPKLRKTTSELNLDTKGPPTWQSPENPPELQSVQVLRNILSRSHANLSVAHQPESTSLSHKRCAPTSNEPSEKTLEHDDNTRWGRTHSVETTRPSRSKFEHSVSLEAEHCNHLNSYRGPPSINLSTWSERPKQQISIKDDGDYRFGFGKKSTTSTRHEDTTRDHLNNNSDELAKRGVCYNPEEGFKLEGKSKSISDLSRIPIVTAVELKKPYCNFEKTSSTLKQELKVSNNDTPNPGSGSSNTFQNNIESFIGVNSLARRFGVPNKRPVSMYDTGNGKNYFHSKKCEKVNKANTIDRCISSPRLISEGENELQEKVKSFHSKYDTTSVIKALSKTRSGGIVDYVPDCSKEIMPQSQLNSSSKDNGCFGSQGLIQGNKWKEINSDNDDKKVLYSNHTIINNNSGSVKQTHTHERNLRPVNLQPVVKGFTRVSIKPHSFNTFVPTTPNVKDSCNVSSTSLNQDSQGYKTALLNRTTVSLTHIKEPAKDKTSNTDSNVLSAQDIFSGKSKVKRNSTIPTPPPPPSLPVLKPFGERKGVKLLPPPEADPRDLLMSSIRSFRRDDLKTISK